MSTYPPRSGAIAATAVLYPGVELGEGVQVEDYVLLGVPVVGQPPGVVLTGIAARAILRSHTVVYAGARIGSHFTCGHACLIQENVQIGDSVSIGAHTIIGPRAAIADHVRIGTNVTILPGVRLGKGCLVGDGAVVTQDVPVRALVVGNPAFVCKLLDGKADPWELLMQQPDATPYRLRSAG